MLSDLPDFVMKKIQELSEQFNVKKEDLTKRYWEIYNDPWIQSDEQFKTDEERHAYVVRVLWVEVASQPPTKEYLVIPYGIREPRVAKSSGIIQSRIYALIKKDDRLENKVIICRGNTADLAYDVELLHYYRVKLSNYGGMLFATAQTRFENGKPLNVDPIKFYIKQLNVLPVKIADTVHKLSKKDQSGKYTDEFDLRLIRGIVIRWNKGKRVDGSDFGVYTIGDDSVRRDMVTPDGKVIPSQFTVWVPPNMVKYDIFSELAFIGTVTLSKDDEPFMNAIAVIPIHAKLIELEEV